MLTPTYTLPEPPSATALQHTNTWVTCKTANQIASYSTCWKGITGTPSFLCALLGGEAGGGKL